MLAPCRAVERLDPDFSPSAPEQCTPERDADIRPGTCCQPPPLYKTLNVIRGKPVVPERTGGKLECHLCVAVRGRKSQRAFQMGACRMAPQEAPQNTD